MSKKMQHQALGDTFDKLFGGHIVDIIIDGEDSIKDSSLKMTILKSFLGRKLSATFGGDAVRFECHVNCARVTVGGFGSQWHHDADSQPTFENVLCEYLAVYYLEPTLSSTAKNPWLECTLLG